ncbi:hypothetical protein HGA13_21930 [Nocardia speluncae]|uniref:Uncharacterized protein n=1 Tax=Nocardia speluncae TaxID=419477 RepID=A0A846XH82_9NOCA|nr:hypothetical protein [Nocardia speluncae]NKY35711.1 hypothetical protein [Nocardia speluncae]
MKGSRLSGVRLRIRHPTPGDVLPVEGLPALTVERAIVDLGTDVSSAAGQIPSGWGFTPEVGVVTGRSGGMAGDL